MEGVSRLVADPEWKRHMNVVSDLRNARIDLTAQEMNEFANWVRQRDTAKLLAIAVSRSLEFGMSRMYQTLTEPDDYEDTKVFHDLTEAEKWVESKSVDC